LFAKYAAIVKNLRGVVLVDLDDENSRSRVKWLIRKFRHRDLGLPPCIVERYKDKLSSYLNGNPFRELVYPIPLLYNLVHVFEAKGFSRELVEALILSSTYISPLLVLTAKYLNDIDHMCIEKVKTCKELDDSSWKLHLRIADYTILDMYEKCIEENIKVLNLLKSNIVEEVNNVLEERITRVKKDKKRYWRIACDSGMTFLYYVDLLRVFVDAIREGRVNIRELVGDYAAALSIVPVVNVSIL